MNDNDPLITLAEQAGWEPDTNLTPYEYLQLYIRPSSSFWALYLFTLGTGFLTGLLLGYFI